MTSSFLKSATSTPTPSPWLATAHGNAHKIDSKAILSDSHNLNAKPCLLHVSIRLQSFDRLEDESARGTHIHAIIGRNGADAIAIMRDCGSSKSRVSLPANSLN
ncbi:hypothetical protein [Stenotrophomonas muris]|uniref:hypothetical protein n=1 Tax=Stenotrophomonas muris TaxID=2963283 RepID=UPI002E78C036|nr:hypothetical protein [Stenotrophomonas muris]